MVPKESHMPSLSVKKVPEDLLHRLRARAQRHHRSLQKELLLILDAAVGGREDTGIEDLHGYVQELNLRTPDESTALIRGDRDRRGRGGSRRLGSGNRGVRGAQRRGGRRASGGKEPGGTGSRSYPQSGAGAERHLLRCGVSLAFPALRPSASHL